MAQGTARGPSIAKDQISSRSARSTGAVSHNTESITFLETAARHLRDAGYTVELDFDHAAGEACLYVDGIEVRFVRTLPAEPLKH